MNQPTRPYVRPILRHDEHGQYTIYPDKRCTVEGCGVMLTSRNRYLRSMHCTQHGPSAQSVQRVPPLPLRLHFAFCEWLNYPASAEAQETLRAAMADFELRSRLRRLIPKTAPVAPAASSSECDQRRTGIPVEDPAFTNPDHRTTRLEFLADCSTYGV
jgi:hypothetical protein